MVSLYENPVLPHPDLCNIILSWNFKHIVNIKTIHGVRAITNLVGYKTIDIVSPSVLLESEG